MLSCFITLTNQRYTNDIPRSFAFLIMARHFEQYNNAPYGHVAHGNISIFHATWRNFCWSRLLKRHLSLSLQELHYHLEWFRDQASLSATEGHRIVIRDETNFSLETDDHRSRVWRGPGQRTQTNSKHYLWISCMLFKHLLDQQNH